MSVVSAGPTLAIALAVVGAACFAGAAVLQHRAVSAESESDDRVKSSGLISLRGLGAVAARPGWLTGLALAAAGTTVHAIALVLAPLTVVQPIGVLAVPLAVLLTAARTKRRPARGVLVGVAISVAGVGAFVGIAAGTAVSTPAPDSATLVAGLVVAAVVVALAGFGLTRSGWMRCVACSMAGAVAFGLVSALVRAVSQSVTSGAIAILHPAVLLTLAGVVAALSVGGWLVQQAFASGPPEVVIACLTVVDPIVAVLLGAVLLGEGANTPAATWLLLALAAAAAAGGVVALARHHPDAAGRSAKARPAAPDPADSGPAEPDRSAPERPAAEDGSAPDEPGAAHSSALRDTPPPAASSGLRPIDRR